MKINPFRHVGMNPYQKQINRSEKAATPPKTDKVEISSQAKEMQQVSSVLKERETKISELKQQIENGTYTIDAKKMAQNITDFYKK